MQANDRKLILTEKKSHVDLAKIKMDPEEEEKSSKHKEI